MARKRLSLPGPFGADPLDGPLPPLETKSTGSGPGPNPGRTSGLGAPPIARVAGDASASAALADMTEAWTDARDNGRLVQALPLAAIHETWLVRDRLSLDTEEMSDLMASLRDRGQQVPIEVVALDDGRFGLISGWRRLRALKALSAEEGGSRFAQVLALLRRPAGAAEAYRAMVEENEIRANLSYYERARIAVRAAEAGAFSDPRAAVAVLFAAGSRAKRSKIASFLTLVEALDDRLQFAGAIPERLGLQLAKRLDDDRGFRDRLRDRLRKADPEGPEQELALLTRAMAGGGAPREGEAVKAVAAAVPEAAPKREELRPGLWLEATGQGEAMRLVLGGAGVDEDLRSRLVAWLRDG